MIRKRVREVVHRSNRTLNRRDFVAATVAGGGAFFSTGGILAGSAKKAGRLRAGAAIADITPPLGVSLDGPISQNGPAVEIHDPLHARCLVLDDGQQRLAIVICDCTMIWRELFDRAKQLAHSKTGLPAEAMLMAATHTHATPRVGIGTGEIDVQYYRQMATGIADAVVKSIENLAPAKIGWGLGENTEYVVNRRWFMKPGSIGPNPFGQQGEQVQMNPGSSADRVKPAGPVDPQIAVLSVQHADGRPLAVLANYGTHYVGGYRRGFVSADYFGVVPMSIGKLLDAQGVDPPFVGIMSNGTSGDVNLGPRPRRPAWEEMQEVGDSIAEEVVRVIGKIEHTDDAPLAMRQSELKLGVRRPDTERLEWARRVWGEAQAKIKAGKQITRPEVYAREAIFLSEYPAGVNVLLQALRIGQLGIAAAPCEVFAETGLAIKQQSALQPTFTIELANDARGYLPTPRQHKLGGYETWPARSSHLEVEAEPQIRAELLRLLGEVAAAAG